MRVAFLVVSLLALALREQIPQRILPVDEGAQDPEFAQFRRELLAAAKKGDLAGIWARTDQRNVWSTARGERGLAALKREWDIDRSPKEFLSELIAVLELGGRFRDDGKKFVAPYVATEFHEVPVSEMIDYVVILLPDVPVHAEAGPGSKVITRVSHAVLPFGILHKGWYSVRLPDGREGFVLQRSARSPGDTAATFYRIGEWRLGAFLAGIE